MSKASGRVRIVGLKTDDEAHSSSHMYYCGVTCEGKWYPNPLDATRFLTEERASGLIPQLPDLDDFVRVIVEPCP